MATDEHTANTAATDPTATPPSAPHSLTSPPASPTPGPSRLSWLPPNSALHFIAGGLGGMSGAIVTAPFDLAKTRLQSDLFARPRPSTLAAAASPITKAWWHLADTGAFMREIARKEGFRALYSGLGPTLAGAVPSRSVNFWAYGNGKAFFAQLLNNGRETPFIHLITAASSGVITATTMNPVWVIKTRLQLEQSQLKPSSPTGPTTSSPSPSSSASRTTRIPTESARRIHTFSPSYTFFRSDFAPRPTALGCMAKIVREEGVPGLYRGLSASYLGVTEGTIQWVLYEQLKSLGRSTSPSSNSSNSTSTSSSKPGSESWLTKMLSAGSAKLVATVITYPHEVVRTRLRQPVREGEKRRYVGLWGLN